MAESGINSESQLNSNRNRRGMHPNSRKNLKPGFHKGKSGNAGGRPNPLTSLIREMIDQDADYIAYGALPTDKTWKQLIARAILRKASDGDVSMVNTLLDRLEGKVVQAISGPAGGPVEVVQTVRHITQEELRPALEALVGAGVVTISRN